MPRYSDSWVTSNNFLFSSDILLTGNELAQQAQQQAEQEKQRAEQEKQRADRLLEILRERGINPDEVL